MSIHLWLGWSALFFMMIAGSATAQNPCGYALTITGQQLYQEYCAACHGVSGKGDGPSAASSAIPPADLTGITRRNNGRFPADRIAEIIRYGGSIPAHDAGPMPVWAKIFSRDCGPVFSRRAVVELKSYIETLQR